jgi:hypothetical protein
VLCAARGDDAVAKYLDHQLDAVHGVKEDPLIGVAHAARLRDDRRADFADALHGSFEAARGPPKTSRGETGDGHATIFCASATVEASGLSMNVGNPVSMHSRAYSQWRLPWRKSTIAAAQ